MEIKRDAYLEQLKIRKDNGMIKISTGIRRCGKSFLLFVLFWDQSFLYKKTPVLSDSKDESPYLPCYHLTSQLSHGNCLCRYPKSLNTLTL